MNLSLTADDLLMLLGKATAEAEALRRELARVTAELAALREKPNNG